jgi:hypothetical protein
VDNNIEEEEKKKKKKKKKKKEEEEETARDQQQGNSRHACNPHFMHARGCVCVCVSSPSLSHDVNGMCHPPTQPASMSAIQTTNRRGYYLFLPS